jgi:hypothetical protein
VLLHLPPYTIHVIVYDVHGIQFTAREVLPRCSRVLVSVYVIACTVLKLLSHKYERQLRDGVATTPPGSVWF